MRLTDVMIKGMQNPYNPVKQQLLAALRTFTGKPDRLAGIETSILDTLIHVDTLRPKGELVHQAKADRDFILGKLAGNLGAHDPSYGDRLRQLGLAKKTDESKDAKPSSTDDRNYRKDLMGIQKSYKEGEITPEEALEFLALLRAELPALSECTGPARTALNGLLHEMAQFERSLKRKIDGNGNGSLVDTSGFKIHGETSL